MSDRLGLSVSVTVGAENSSAAAGVGSVRRAAATGRCWGGWSGRPVVGRCWSRYQGASWCGTSGARVDRASCRTFGRFSHTLSEAEGCCGSASPFPTYRPGSIPTERTGRASTAAADTRSCIGLWLRTSTSTGSRRSTTRTPHSLEFSRNSVSRRGRTLPAPTTVCPDQ